MAAETTIRRRIREHREAVDRLDADRVADLADAAQLLIDALAAGHRVYVCGNGGSAADAQHIACELMGRFLADRRALPCVALGTDTSGLTAIANDYGYDRTFARQAEALLTAGDVLWALSTSGDSPNVLAAVEVAKAKGAKVLGFTGGDGGRLKGASDVCFVAPADGSFAIQQLHQIAYHVICELVEARSGASGDTEG